MVEQMSGWSRLKCELLVLKWRESKSTNNTNKFEIAPKMNGPNITVLFDLVKRVQKALWRSNYKLRSERWVGITR